MSEKRIEIRIDTSGIPSKSQEVVNNLNKIDAAANKVSSINVGVNTSSVTKSLNELYHLFTDFEKKTNSAWNMQSKNIIQVSNHLHDLGKSYDDFIKTGKMASAYLQAETQSASVAIKALSTQMSEFSSGRVPFKFDDLTLTPLQSALTKLNDGFVMTARLSDAMLHNLNSAALQSVSRINSITGSIKSLQSSMAGIIGEMRALEALNPVSISNKFTSFQKPTNYFTTASSFVPNVSTEVRRRGDLLTKDIGAFSTSYYPGSEVTPDISSDIIGIGGGSIRKASSELKELSTNAKSATISSESLIAGFNKISTASHKVTGAIFSFNNLLMGMAVSYVVRDLVDVSTTVQRLQSSFIAATDSIAGASVEMNYVIDFSKKMGVDLKAAAMNLAQMEIAAKGTSLEGKGVKEIFEAVSMASVSMGLSTEQTSGALYALQQMMSKGRVSTEELRRQLGERLPGAFQFAARAMGVTTAQLDKMLDQGEVYAEEMLPKMAKIMKEEFAAAIPVALKSLQTELNRTSTALFQLRQSAAEGGFAEGFSGLLSGVRESIEGLISSGTATEFGKWSKTVLEYGEGIIRSWGGVPDVLEKNAASYERLATVISALAVSVGTLVAVGGLSSVGAGLVGLIGGPAAAIVTGLSLLSGVVFAYRKEIYGLVDSTYAFNQEAEKTKAVNASLKQHFDSSIATVLEMKDATFLTADENQKLYDALSNICDILPQAKSLVDEYSNGLISTTEFVEKLTKAERVYAAQQDYNNALKEQRFLQGQSTSGMDYYLGIYGKAYGSDMAVTTQQNEMDKKLADVEERVQKARDAYMEVMGLKPKKFDYAAFAQDYLEYILNPAYDTKTAPEFKKPGDELDKKALDKYSSNEDKLLNIIEESTAKRLILRKEGLEKELAEVDLQYDKEREAAVSLYQEMEETKGISDDKLVKAQQTTEAALAAISKEWKEKRLTIEKEYNEKIEKEQKDLAEELLEAFDPQYKLGKQMDSYKKLLEQGLIPQDVYDRAIKEAGETAKELRYKLMGIDLGEIERIKESVNPQDTYEKEMANNTKALNEGLLTQKEYTIALVQAREKLRDATKELMLQENTWLSGAKVAFMDYYDSAQKVAKNTYSIFSNALSGLEDAIVEFASTGENSFKQLLSSIQTEIFRLYIVRPALASIFGGAGGATGGGGMFGSYFAGVPSGGYSGGNSGGLFGSFFSNLFGSFLGGFDDGGISRGKGFFYAGTDELHIPLNRLNSVTNNKSNVVINLTQVIGSSKDRRYQSKQLNKTERQMVRETAVTLARFT